MSQYTRIYQYGKRTRQLKFKIMRQLEVKMDLIWMVSLAIMVYEPI